MWFYGLRVMHHAQGEHKLSKKLSKSLSDSEVLVGKTLSYPQSIKEVHKPSPNTCLISKKLGLLSLIGVPTIYKQELIPKSGLSLKVSNNFLSLSLMW